MKYNFDEIIDRSEFNSTKYEGYQDEFPDLNTEGAVPMWIADMDFLSPREVIDAMIKRAKHGIYGYNSAKGSDKFVNALLGWVKKRYHWNVDKSSAVVTPGVVPAMSFAIQAVTKPGDGVLSFSPVYYPITNAVINNGRVNKNISLLEEDGVYKIDFEKLEQAASEPDTKLLMMCSPHNPIGRVWTEEELKKIADICLRNNVVVFSDEIHADIVFGDNRHTPIASLSPEIEQNSITAYAPGKTFNLACTNAGVAVIPNEEIGKKFWDQLVCNGFANPMAAFGAVAGEAAYLYGESYVEELLPYIEGNMDYACAYIHDRIPGVSMRKPEGTYLAWIDFREMGLTNEELDRLVMEKARVILNPGWWFGQEGTGFMRMNLACPRSVVKEGLSRLEKAVKEMI